MDTEGLSDMKTRTERQRSSMMETQHDKFTDLNTSADYLHHLTIQSLIDNHIIVNKPTKRELSSYYITNEVSEDSFDRESEVDSINENSIIFGHLFAQKLKDTERDLTPKKRSNEEIHENEIIENLQNSILNLNAEIRALKSFVKDELSLSKNIDRVRTEQCNQTHFMKEMKKKNVRRK